MIKNRKNILPNIVAALAILVTSASWSPAAPPIPPPQNYSGTLTHAEFITCTGQVLNPPAYSVEGTWVLKIDRATQAQRPAAGLPDDGRLPRRPTLPAIPAHRVDAGLGRRWRLHLLVRSSGDGDARYEYESGHVLVARRIRRQLSPSRDYRSLAYIGVANN